MSMPLKILFCIKNSQFVSCGSVPYSLDENKIIIAHTLIIPEINGADATVLPGVLLKVHRFKPLSSNSFSRSEFCRHCMTFL